MIQSIHMADIATYGGTPEILDGLSTFNFIFGCNGSGKTTITRVIADEPSFPTCSVTWKGDVKLQAMVYNRDFVGRNFDQSPEIKGIFTLGEENLETLTKIAAAKKEIDGLTSSILSLNFTLQGQDGSGGKKGELAELEAEFKDKCWIQKQKHDATFSVAFEGYRNSAQRFKEKLLAESDSNSATLESLPDLQKRAQIVFSSNLTPENSMSPLKAADLLAHETNPILEKRVLGKQEVDIAAMITRLGNSDWVRQGRTFYETNDKVCPFCQQNTSDAFAKSFNDYFDKTFEEDCEAINAIQTSYKTDSNLLQKHIERTIATPSKFIDVEKLKSQKALLDSRITVNLQRLDTKKKEPSQSVALESLTDVISAIENLVSAANLAISDNNDVVANLVQQRHDLSAQVWKYLLEVDLKADLATYKTKKNSLNKAIEAITQKITTGGEEKTTKIKEIRELEKTTTSIQPTMDAINRLLSSSGFNSFSLAMADDGISYKLVRPDGADAKETLSEGEKAFVTFLYFYHLLEGSDSDSGTTTDRVIVFDDPVSSLDSEFLFIVASLIKALFAKVRSGAGHIKQVFVLTHNVYFYKEVTYNPKRVNQAMNEETFWIVRKSGLLSQLEKHNSNPVKTSYDLLWAEVRNPLRPKLTIQNTLRRILEHYFKILGGIDTDWICEKFDGNEKWICKSLFSWVSEGSHYALDDLYTSIDDKTVDTYLNVFRAIFEKSEHIAHYKMMMGDAYIESAPVSAPASPEEI